jgi:very-short-patch-repair endonuclease
MNDAWDRLVDLAERQHAVFALEDARCLGVPVYIVRERAASNVIERVYPEVFRIRGSRPTARQRAKAATLWLGEPASVSHPTAARLLRLDGDWPRDLRVSVPRATSRGRNAATDVRLHRVRDLPGIDRRVVDTIPCTSAARTMLDLAVDLDDERFEVAAESARRMGLMTTAVLARRFEALGRRAGADRVRRYIVSSEGQPAVQYRLEVKTRRLLEQLRLPPFRRQLPIRGADGERYFVDFVFEAQRLIVECDGFAWHGNHLQWKRDRKRVAALEAAGWRLLHLTWDDVTRRPAEVETRLLIALGLAAV